MKKQIPILVGIVVAGVALAFVLTPKGEQQDPTTQSNEEIVETMASTRFEKLPDEKKRAYTDELWSRRREEGSMRSMSQNLSASEQERFRVNVGGAMRARMMERVDAYFELPSAERAAYLDQMIDEQDARRMEWRRREAARAAEEGAEASSEAREGRHRRGPPSADRLKGMIENQTPENRAKMLEFFKAMREHREQRGD
jgi:hypothetical protein